MKTVRRILRVVVVVPARDEELLIERCLASLLVARDRLAQDRPEIAVRLAVVADACVDRTEELCRAVDGIELLSSSLGRVGAARAHGIETLLPEFGGPDLGGEGSGGAGSENAGSQGAGSEGARPADASPETAWIANTDADSVVPPNWLTHQVELAEGGADVYIGTVRPDPRDLTPDQVARWESTHTPGHANGHVHGANLGVRASVYRGVGGFEALDEHEDNQLVARLKETGAVVVASHLADVLTSGRFVGRTPGGYAHHLAETL